MLVVLALLAGCSGRPSLQEAEPAVLHAVRTVVGAEAEVRRTVSPRCGPTDERLDGLHLQLRADVAPGSVDLAGAARDLRRSGFDVEVGNGRQAPLLAAAAGGDRALRLWPGADGRWLLTATAEVDGDPRTADGAVQPCG